jgi:hypothetical protein
MRGAADQPPVFISYSHPDRELAQALTDGLKAVGHRVWIDEGELRTGDSLIEKIATAISEVDFLVALVTPASVESSWCQKELSLAITGELGREGMKVLPLRVGEVEMPPSLRDLKYLRVEPQAVEEAVQILRGDLRSYSAEAEERARTPERHEARHTRRSTEQISYEGPPTVQDDPIKIVGIVEEGVGEPDRHPARGSALYRVPLRLSRTPSREWGEFFERTWDRPPSFTTLHRPGICKVVEDAIVLDGTTIEELETVHIDTLRLVLETTNQTIGAAQRREREQEERQAQERERHQQEVRDAARRLKFE